MSMTKKWMDAQELTLAQKLDHARRACRFVQLSVTASEGRVLDYATADEMSAALVGISRNLEELSLSIAVLERKVH